MRGIHHFEEVTRNVSQDALHVVALVLQVRHERRYGPIRICLFLPCYSSFMARSRRVTGHGLGTRKILTSSFEAV